MYKLENNNSKKNLERELAEQGDIVEKLLEEKCQLTRILYDQKEYIEKLNIDINNKTEHIEKLMESERYLRLDIQNKTIDINNKTGHIEQLIVSERKLNDYINNILASRSYKFASALSYLSRKVFPIYSKRRQFIKFFIKFFRHP